jgi:amino acid adenylation domain-containing protein
MSKPEQRSNRNPDQGEADLSMLTEAEKTRLLIDWNNNKTDYPKDKCIHELFEAQVDRTPNAVALILDERSLSYSELNRRANQLAHYLRSLGVGPEMLVGVCLERSIEMIVGILGILKAGGAYVPLDPAYPKERLALMLKDSQVPILVTEEKFVGEFDAFEMKLVLLDRDWHRIGEEDGANQNSGVVQKNLAYVIYTSGSTGKPKGVAIEHRSAVALLDWATSTFKLERLKGVLVSTSVCFDLSVYEIFAPLSCGGAMILAQNILYLPSLPAANEVTLINGGPSAIRELLRIKGIPPSVKTVNVAGEPLTTPLVRKIYNVETVKEVFDLYGPTEDTTFSTFALRDTERATIGRPISNTQAYILNADLQLVPIGAVGELYLSGAGLARGYLNRPELTEERFIANPFSTEPDARMYKTGDLARFFPTGEIEYLGRLDNQVKLRGHRVEPGEIEIAISEYPGVREVVVIAREDQPGEKRLVAYFVLEEGSSLVTSELRDHLEQKLPAYMMPSAFVELERLPLNPNGKIDRQALSPPERNSFRPRAAFVAPRDEIELKLGRIWKNVLGTGTVGVRDSFFELGGDSLLAARIFSEANSVFGTALPLATVFQGDTIEQLAALLRQNKNNDFEGRWSSLVPIQSGGSKHPFFCVHGAGGNVVNFRALSQYLGPEQPFYGLQSVGLDGKTPPLTSIQAMAAHYLKAISDFQPEGPYFLGGLSFGGVVAFEMACQLHKQGREVGCVALLDASLRGELTLTERIGMHVTQLLSSGGPLNYAKRVAEAGKKKLKKKFVSKNWTVRYDWYRDSEDQVPQLLRQMRENNYKALSEYVLPTYPGTVALFRSDDRSMLDSELLGWNEFAADIELYPTPGNHVTFVKEPHVRVLAEQLIRCLNRASLGKNGRSALSAAHG